MEFRKLKAKGQLARWESFNPSGYTIQAVNMPPLGVMHDVIRDMDQKRLASCSRLELAQLHAITDSKPE